MSGFTTAGFCASGAREGTVECRARRVIPCWRYSRRLSRYFAEAERIRPSGNDDAILRWNRCVRLLQNPAYGWDELEQELVAFDAHDAPPR